MRYLIPMVAIILAGCAQTPTSNGQITNYETKGNLQSNAPLSCVALSSVTNKHTPADIYPGVTKCVTSGSYDKAAQLFALAGVYGRFDMLRVSDSTARQAIQVLQLNNFDSFTDEQREVFKKTMGTYLSPDSKEFLNLCAQIKAKGAPNYHPSYMIQHGMGAFAGSSGNGIKSDFDTAKGWQESINGYLHCP